MKKVHASTKEKVGVAKALSQSKIRSLLAQTIDESTSMSDFSCTICDKTLKTKANLEKHNSQVHGDASMKNSVKNVARERLGSRSQPSRRRSISLDKHKGKRKY